MLGDLFNIKNGALAMLVLQNTFLVVFMRYSRTATGALYASSTAVVMMEVVKFISCYGVILVENKSFKGFFRQVYYEVFMSPMELVKCSVPSLVYTVQNNLLYFALTHLDAATYQVCYQAKILTTAIFSVFILGRSLSFMQWFSLVVLTSGVSLAQLSSVYEKGDEESRKNTMAGFMAVMLAAILSGFAGVYFEMILKNSSPSIWMRNIHMGFTSIPLALLGVYFSGEGAQVLQQGFFYGYNSLVVSAVGGLVVAVVVKYADNILKGFAASFSIITSCILTMILFDFRPNAMFTAGAALVNISMYLYSNSPATPAKAPTTPKAQQQHRKLDEKV